MANRLLEKELEGSFRFLWEASNQDSSSAGYGLTLDRSNDLKVASVAAVGFALTAYVIGVSRGYITRAQGLERARGTLRTLRDKVPHYKGFMAHFVDVKTAEMMPYTEYSTIDTALALNGALTADRFFNDALLSELTAEVFNRVDWNALAYTEPQGESNRTLFHMAYNEKRGFYGSWDMCAEQLMLYLLAAAHDEMDATLAQQLYLGFDRPLGEYGGHRCYYEPGGTLFVYQYSHAWFDFSRYAGCDGINWAENSRNATRAQIAWCRDHQEIETFRAGLWGVSACDSPRGYAVQGTPPRLRKDIPDGTIAPCAIAGALPFVYDESAAALTLLQEKYPALWGVYGFKDGFNAAGSWCADTYLGIDKGESALMIANVQDGIVWEQYMSHPFIQRAVQKLAMRTIPEKA